MVIYFLYYYNIYIINIKKVIIPYISSQKSDALYNIDKAI